MDRDEAVGQGARRGANVAVVALVVALFGAMLLGGIVTPFHYVDVLVVVAVAIGPALLVLLAGTWLGGRFVAALAGNRPVVALDVSCGLVLFGIVAPGNVLLYANERLDRSPAIVETVPVIETWIRSGRHQGSTTYLAGVGTAVTSPLGRRSFYDMQPVALRRATWERVEPGRTRLVLREHSGFFRVPWYEPNPALIDARPAP